MKIKILNRTEDTQEEGLVGYTVDGTRVSLGPPSDPKNMEVKFPETHRVSLEEALRIIEKTKQAYIQTAEQLARDLDYPLVGNGNLYFKFGEPDLIQSDDTTHCEKAYVPFNLFEGYEEGGEFGAERPRGKTRLRFSLRRREGKADLPGED